MKTPEGYEKDDICKYLDSIEAWYFRPYSAGFGRSGISDIVGCLHGRFFSIEVKRTEKEPTRLQEIRMEEITQAGGYAVAGDAKTVIALLKKWQAS